MDFYIKRLSGFVMIISCLVMSIPFEISDGFYLSHFLLLVIFPLALFVCFAKRKISLFCFFILLLIFLFVFIDFLNYGINGFFPKNFKSDSIKFFLLLIGIFSYSVFFEKVNQIFFCSVVGVFVIFNGVWYLFSGDASFSYGGRFIVSGFGSPNTYAIILSFCSTFFIYKLKEKFSLPIIFLICLSIFLLILTESRGGLFSFLIGAFLIFFRGIDIKRFVITLLFFMVVLFSFYYAGLWDRLFDMGDGYSSGRVDIWKKLYGDLLGNTKAFFFGFGSGSVNFSMFNKQLDSAHSGFLTIHYYYGLLYLLLFLSVVSIRMYRVYLLDGVSCRLKLAIFSIFFFSFSSDSLFLSSQGTVYFSFFMAYALSLNRVNKNNKLVIL